VRLLPSREVADGYLIVDVLLGLGGHVDDHGFADETLERHLVHGVVSLCKVDRRVQMRAAMLGGAEIVGGIVIARRCPLRRDHREPKRCGRGPIESGGVEGIGEIHPGALRESIRHRPAGGTHRAEHEDNKDALAHLDCSG
jgi:hypothetical protein